MSNSILISMKEMLGIDEECLSFDSELTVLINSVFSTLYQIGFNPVKDFRIEDDKAKWTDILNANQDIIDLIKPYMYIELRMLFDPPTSSFVLESLKKQRDELEWRIYIQSEGGFKEDDESK